MNPGLGDAIMAGEELRGLPFVRREFGDYRDELACVYRFRDRRIESGGQGSSRSASRARR